MAVKKMTRSEFKESVEKGEGRIVVDFFATWCGPCHQVAHSLEDLATRWEGKVRFVKVDIDENPDLADRYSIATIPTIALFEGGRMVAKTIGARPANAIERELGLGTHQAA